jgi:6-phosphogluconolactonase
VKLPTIISCADKQRVAELSAELVRDAAHAAIDAHGAFCWALSGGSTPQALYKLLAERGADYLPWAQVALYWGDERCVPPDHDASNYQMVKQLLLDHVSPGTVHRIEGELAPAEAAARYATKIERPLDVVLLGMGGDGHTASLFPQTDALSAVDTVIATKSPAAPHERVSLSMGAINAAQRVLLQVTGESKAERLAQVLGELERGEPSLPISLVQPGGEYLWIVDDAAASKLPERET